MNYNICRPEKITCRWIKEITESISNVCLEENKVCISKIINCDNMNIFELNHIFENYLNIIRTSSCKNSKIVKDILEFNVDYNNFRN
jgi:hypothetical protein